MHRTFGVVTLLFLGSGLHLRMVAPARAADCNSNGIEDADELAVCPPIDVVFIMDTSQSMSCVSMKRLLAVKDRFAFLGVSIRRQPPFRRGLKPRGLGASSPQETGDCAPAPRIIRSWTNRVPRIHSDSTRRTRRTRRAGGSHYVAFERRLM